MPAKTGFKAMCLRTNNNSPRNIPTGAATKGRSGGWLMTETLFAIAIGISFLVALMGIFVTSSFNFAGVGNYINMDRNSRNALDQMSRNIRNSKVLTSFAPAALVFSYDAAGATNLAYRYKSDSRLVTEE